MEQYVILRSSSTLNDIRLMYTYTSVYRSVDDKRFVFVFCLFQFFGINLVLFVSGSIFACISAWIFAWIFTRLAVVHVILRIINSEFV